MIQASPLSIDISGFGYSGEITDGESQLQYLNARFYHPMLNRFVSRDSVNLLNRYAYANGNPVLNSDPSGHIAALLIFGMAAIAPEEGLTSLAVDEEAAEQDDSYFDIHNFHDGRRIVVHRNGNDYTTFIDHPEVEDRESFPDLEASEFPVDGEHQVRFFVHPEDSAPATHIQNLLTRFGIEDETDADEAISNANDVLDELNSWHDQGAADPVVHQYHFTTNNGTVSARVVVDDALPALENANADPEESADENDNNEEPSVKRHQPHPPNGPDDPLF